MIKHPLLLRLLEQRLRHNESFLLQGHNTQLESLKLSYQNKNIYPETVLGYKMAICEENEFLRAALEKKNK